MNSSYAYAEVLEVLDNMDEIYVSKIPPKFISFLKENASKNYQKHIVTTKELEDQNLDVQTLNILALINLKYWVESEEHKQELLAQYKENEKKKMEKLSEHFDSSSIFDKTKDINNNTMNIEKSNNLPIEKKSIFRKIVDYFKSKIFEN